MRISDWSSDVCSSDLDFVRQFVGVLIFRFESGLLGGERLNGRLFLERQIDRRAGDLAETPHRVIREADRHLDPSPALGGDRLGLGLQLLGDEAIEKPDVLQPRSEEHTSELQSLLRNSY